MNFFSNNICLEVYYIIFCSYIGNMTQTCNLMVVTMNILVLCVSGGLMEGLPHYLVASHLILQPKIAPEIQMG